MESIIRDEIVDFLAQNELLRLSQHGFMRKRSTLTNLLEYLEQLTAMVDKGVATDVVYLDFSKAFDKVDHGVLLHKLKQLGVGGKVGTWLATFLSNRYQIVACNGVKS